MNTEWPIRNLGDVCRVIGGGTPSKAVSEYYHGNIPWATVRDMSSDVITATECKITKTAVESSATNIIPGGNVVIATRVGLGKICLLGQDTAINQDLRGIIPLNGNLSVRYLFWWFKSISDTIVAAGKGATVQGITLPYVKSLQIPLPSNSEQRRIVGILDQAFAGIAAAKANAEKSLQNARALFEAYLFSAFEKCTDHMGAGKALVDLCELIVDCEHKTAPTQETGIPSIRTPNIGRGKLLLDGVYRVSEETYLKWTQRAEPRAGDLILAREAPAGNVAVIPENLRVCLGQRTVLIRPCPNIFVPEFLAFILLQPGMQKKLLAHSRGATVQHVNMKDIRALIISRVPSLKIQRDFVSRVQKSSEQSEQLIASYQRKLAMLDSLKKSLLHQAFTGNL